MTLDDKYNAALAYAFSGNEVFDLGKAATLLEDVVETNPNHELARHFLADCYRRLGKQDLRLKTLLAGHEIAPSAWKKIQIAACLLDLGQHEEGLKWIEDEDLDPSLHAMSGLTIRAKLYQALGMTELAAADQNRMDVYEAGQPSVWDEID